MFKRSLHTSRSAYDAAPVKNINEAFKSATSMQSKIQTTVINDRFIPNMTNKKTYDPFDFSISAQRYQTKVNKAQMANYMKSSSFNSREINPTDFYVIPHLLNGYMNSSGQILHRDVTGLSPRKQKQMAKAIRRARAFGFLSSVAKDVSTFDKRNL